MLQPIITLLLATLKAIFYFSIALMSAIKTYQKLNHQTFVAPYKITDKVVIVTGANTGIGYVTARELSRRGARVILACRNLDKAKAAAQKIQSLTTNDVIAKQLDLASFQSVLLFAKDIVKTEKNIHILINNAGTGVLDNSLTKDMLPIEAQVNYFGPFLLTMLLLPTIKASVSRTHDCRIINVTSIMHYFGTVENLDKQAENFLQRRRVYANTKLANILFTRKLAEEVGDSGITVNCLHPGAVYTDIFRDQPTIVKLILKFLFLTPLQGAQASIFLAVAKPLRQVTGAYFSNCNIELPSKRAQDDEAAQKLWDLSHKICFNNKLW